MSLQDFSSFKSPTFDSERAMRLGVGMTAAPLWAGFFAVATAGAAYWWMTTGWQRRAAQHAGEIKSFAPVDPTPVANDAVPASAIPAETVMAHAPEPQVAPVPVETAPAPVAVEAVMEHREPEAPATAAQTADVDTPAQTALEQTQAEVAALAAEAALQALADDTTRPKKKKASTDS